MEKHLLPIEMLHNAGYEAYFVGGCTRDRLLARPLSDIDITTNALPEEIKTVFSAYRTLDIGIKHGTVTVMMENASYEITTYRHDGDYADHRHPTKVRFGVSLREDLSRRDFTVNAIAYDGGSDYKDPFGGKGDIENKIIRCVGQASLRFEEDALRILRGLRFASVLGFSVEENTARAMREKKHLLRFVSAERVYGELTKLLMGDDAAEILMQYSDILDPVLPELADMRGFDQKNPHHIYDVLTHTLTALRHAERDLVLRLAVLFHDCGKPHTFSLDENGIGHFYGHAKKSVALAEARLCALKVDNRTKMRVLRLVEHHDSPPEESLSQVVRRMRKLEDDYPLLVALRRADNKGQAPRYHRTELHDKCMEMYREAMTAEEEKTGRRLSLDGNDLLKAGALPGKNIGSVLSFLSDAVLENKTENEKEALLSYAKTHFKDGFKHETK